MDKFFNYPIQYFEAEFAMESQSEVQNLFWVLKRTVSLRQFFCVPDKIFFIQWNHLNSFPHRFRLTNFQRNIVNIFLSIIFSVCFGCSNEPSH